jgi:hypothetical protein
MGRCVGKMKTFKEMAEPRHYPDGALISAKLPDAYAKATGEKNCANCGAFVPGTKYCKTWDAKVRPDYYCKKWIKKEK